MTADTPSGPITQLFSAWNQGDTAAREQLLEALYPELKVMASRRLAAVGRPITLDSVDLLHEAYLKLVDQRQAEWQNRQHFFALAARVVRRVLMDHLRHRFRDKRGGQAENLPIDDITLAVEGIDIDLMDLDRALVRLEEVDPQAARVVELRYFAGLGHDETAAALGIGRATVGRSWRFARAFLKSHL